MPRFSAPVRASASSAMRRNAIAHPSGLLDIESFTGPPRSGPQAEKHAFAIMAAKGPSFQDGFSPKSHRQESRWESSPGGFLHGHRHGLNSIGWPPASRPSAL